MKRQPDKATEGPASVLSSTFSASFHRYGNVRGWGLRGEIKEQGEGDAGTSTTSDTEVARNPHQPEGWRRDGHAG